MPAARAETLSLVLRVACLEVLEQEVKGHHLGERRRMAEAVRIGGEQNLAIAGIDGDGRKLRAGSGRLGGAQGQDEGHHEAGHRSEYTTPPVHTKHAVPTCQTIHCEVKASPLRLPPSEEPRNLGGSSAAQQRAGILQPRRYQQVNRKQILLNSDLDYCGATFS
jgi:hypothetical protein